MVGLPSSPATNMDRPLVHLTRAKKKLLAVKYFKKFCQLSEGRYLNMSAEFQRTDFEFEYAIQESMMLETFLSVIYILDLIGQLHIIYII